MASRRVSSRELRSKCRQIRMVIMDVDGVMTDGRIVIGGDGSEYKLFDAHDGYGIDRAAKKGLTFAIVSGRSSKATSKRAKELGITEVHQGVKEKALVVKQMQVRHGLRMDELCYIGDDVFDLPVLETVGLSAAPDDAIMEVRKRVDYVTSTRGGRGAVREVIDLILAAQNLMGTER